MVVGVTFLFKRKKNPFFTIITYLGYPALKIPEKKMKKMKELSECDRPREKIAAKGAEALSDQELVAAILGRGTRNNDIFSVSREITRYFSEHPRDISFEGLASLPGVGRVKATQILASLEFARRMNPPVPVRRKITRPEDVLPLVSGIIGKRQEHFICVTLNGAHELIESRVITVGLLNHSLVHPREVFADAITDRAAAVICVHNHPSGTLEPSNEDVSITRQLADAGQLLGIRVLDHLIVTENGFLSLKERGVL